MANDKDDTVKDISEEVAIAKQCVISGGNTPGDHWSDYMNWKGIRSAGFDKVRIDGKDYEYTKHGVIGYEG